MSLEKVRVVNVIKHRYYARCYGIMTLCNICTDMPHTKHITPSFRSHSFSLNVSESLTVLILSASWASCRRRRSSLSWNICSTETWSTIYVLFVQRWVWNKTLFGRPINILRNAQSSACIYEAVYVAWRFVALFTCSLSKGKTEFETKPFLADHLSQGNTQSSPVVFMK